MPIFGEKPFTSITVKVNQICKLRNGTESIELYLGDLLSLISLQPTGATEAARAIRKMIKYGNNSEAKLAMSLLELLVLNGGLSIGKVLASDDKLIAVVRNVLKGGHSGLSRAPYEEETVKEMKRIALGWSYELKDLPGLQPLATLCKDVPMIRSSKHFNDVPQNKTSKENDAQNSDSSMKGNRATDRAPERPKTLSPSIPREECSKRYQRSKSTKKRDKKAQNYADLQFKIPQINYKVEAPKIRAVIADCQTNATALDNSIISLPSTVSLELDSNVQSCFKKCKATRRSVLRYLQFVGAGNIAEKELDVRKLDEEFLGSLIAANDLLVRSLKRYDMARGAILYNTKFDPDAERDAESSASEEDLYESGSSYSDTEEFEPPSRLPEIPSLNRMEEVTSLSRSSCSGTHGTNTMSAENPFGDPF